MIKSCSILLTLFSLFQCIVQEMKPDTDCGNNAGTRRTLKLSANSRRNQSGDWVDTFTARTESSISSDRMDLDITHYFYECEGKIVIYIQGVSKVNTVGVSNGRLSFYQRCGKNIAILNKGRTVQKISNDDPVHSVVFTNRPLRNNEIFEVRLDKKNTKFSRSLGIGIITRTADDVEILPEMFRSSLGIGIITRTADDVEILPEMFRSQVAWIYHHNHIYSNNEIVVNNYGKNLDDLQVGDRIGVMRSEFGTLHFFVNGVDQGPAASNIPSPVYGLFELWYNAMKATIVDASSAPSS